MELQKAISATQPEGALKAEALSQIKCNPREVSYRIKSVVTLQSALPRLHTQLRGTCELYQFGTNTTPHPRLECFHSIDSCSTQPHETWVISHDYTEAQTPIKPGLSSLFFNSSLNPKQAAERDNQELRGMWLIRKRKRSCLYTCTPVAKTC